MTEEHLESICTFLDTASDFYGSGYRAEREKHDYAAMAARLSGYGGATAPLVLVHIEPAPSQAELELLDKMLLSIGLVRGTNAELTGGPLEPALAATSAPIVLALSRDGDLEARRGSFLSRAGKAILWSYPPEAILANPALKRPAWEDLKLLKTRIPDSTADGGESPRGR